MKTAATGIHRAAWASLGCVLALLVIVGSSCRKEGSPGPEPDAPEPNTAQIQTAPPVETPAPAEPSPVAVTVNGEPITEAQVDERIDYYLRSNPQTANMPPALLTQIKANIRGRMVDALVSQCLLNQEVRAAGVEVDDAEVMAAIEQRGAAQNPPVSVDQFKQIVEARGGDFEQVKDQFKEGMALERFMEPKLAGKTDVNDTEARVFYDENQGSFSEPEQVRASHILIGFSDPADPNADPNEAKAAAKAKAEDLLGQIKAGGDFAELAQTHSIDPGSAAKGGDLDFFTRGKMVAPFEETAFALEPNEVSDVVETQFGYHIIKATGHKDERTVPFEEAKATIVAQLKRQKQSQFVQEYLQSLKDKATIVYPPGSAAPAAVPSAPQTPRPAARPSATPDEPNTN